MSHTITIRLTKPLAEWLAEESAKTGQPQGKIVREQLEKSRKGGAQRSFMKLAGKFSGPPNLSQRKGFSTK